uniref:UrcA family protein n=1 Tax=Parerythrobacter lutipelagi TaxID=1964208 RepID=UPI001375FB61|nr:UrcA family protein [Parerythrobacter lutipelagi]
MKRPLIATLGAALAFSAVAAPAHADELKVAFSDLNLASSEGQATLEARIDRAAKDVCGYNDINTGSRMFSREIKQCYEKAKKSATRQMASVVDDSRLGG